MKRRVMGLFHSAGLGFLCGAGIIAIAGKVSAETPVKELPIIVVLVPVALVLLAVKPPEPEAISGE